MPTLKERLSEEMKSAMKGGDKEKLGFVRNLHAAIRKKEIDDRVDLDDAAIAKIAQTLLKQDLVAKEEAEARFLQTYLPEQMGADEVRKLVDWAVTESKAASAKDMGAVMKLLMPKVQGKADGKLVNQLVKERLG